MSNSFKVNLQTVNYLADEILDLLCNNQSEEALERVKCSVKRIKKLTEEYE
jgi:hypothetical protein